MAAKYKSMERVVNIARSFEEADDWDIKQCLEMTSVERQRVARTLRERLHPNPEDIRDCLRDRSKPVIFHKTYRS